MHNLKSPRLAALRALALAFSLQPSALVLAAPLGAAFTYQGRLNDGGQAAWGIYDLRFAVYDAVTNGSAVGGVLTNAATAVANGLFTVTLDFGSSPFNIGQARWLEIEVRTNGAIAFTALTPRQALTPTPYSLYAQNAGTAALSDRARGGSITTTALADGAVTGAKLASGAITPGLLPTNVAYLDASSQTFTGQNAFNTLVVDPFALNNGAVWSGLVFGSVASGEGIGSKRTTGGNQYGLDLYTWSAPRLSITGPGNVGIGTNDPQSALHVAGVVTATSYTGSGNGLSDLWKLNGNAGTTPGTQFLGTTDNQPVEVRVNNSRALQFVPQANGVVQIIAGYRSNEITGAQSAGSVIAGGGSEPEIRYHPRDNIWTTNSRHQVVSAAFSFIGGGMANTNQSDYSVVAGGNANRIDTNVPNSVISGGGMNQVLSQSNFIQYGNTIGGGAWNKIEDATQSTIAGGVGGGIGPASRNATIGGGNFNKILSGTSYSTIAGGGANTIQTNAANATIRGGEFNTIGTNAQWATIPGGRLNEAWGKSSFAAGQLAHALHNGAFVWGDSSRSGELPYAYVVSTNADSWTVRASGGYRFFADSNATVGAYLPAGGNAWSPMSDRNVKENFRPVDPRTILEKVVALPVTEWNLISQPAEIRHLGPIAQDFQSAFGLGESDRHISTSDADGVALAAIQGLNAKVEGGRQKAEDSLRNLEAKSAALEKEVTELKALVRSLAAKVNGGGQ